MGANPTIYCLEKLTDYAEFERLCTDLMSRLEFRDIEPLGGFKDKGRDAIHVSKTGQTTIFAYSVCEGWRAKLKEDAEKIKRHNHTCDRLIFMTTTDISSSQRDESIKFIKEQYGWDLDIYGLERLRNFLEVQFPEIRHKHPQIFPPALLAAENLLEQGISFSPGNRVMVERPELVATKEDVIRLKEDIAHLIKSTLSYKEDYSDLQADIDEEYKQDIEEAGNLLKTSYFRAARDLLERIKQRPLLKKSSPHTQAKILRLHGLACMRLGDNEVADISFTEAVSLCEPEAKLRLNRAELDLQEGRLEQAEAALNKMISEKEIAKNAYHLLALAALDRKDIGLARKYFSEEAEPSDPANLSGLAFCDMIEGKYDDALGHVNQAIECQPDDPKLLLQKGIIQLEKLLDSPGMRFGISQIGLSANNALHQEVMNDLRRAVKAWDEHGLRDYSAQARVKLATALMLGDHISEALKEATEATKCANADCSAWLIKARAELDSGEMEEAQRSVNRALELVSKDAAAITLHALLTAKRGKHLKAAEEIGQGFDSNWELQQQIDARAMQADLLWTGGRQKEALELIDGLPEKIRLTPRIIVLESEFLIRANREQEAVVILENAIKRYKDELTLLYSAGNAHHQAGDFRQALRRYAGAYRLAPNLNSLKGAAFCLIEIGQSTVALRLLERAVELGIHRGEVADLRAQALYKSGRLEEAAGSYEEYASRHNDDTFSLNNAVACWWQLGRRDRIYPLMERIVELERNSWEACGKLAQLYLTDGKSDEAHKWAKEALDRGANNPEAGLFYFNIAMHTGHEQDAWEIFRQQGDMLLESKNMRRMSEEEGIAYLRQIMKEGSEIQQFYENRKLPITFVANRNNRALVLYRVILQCNKQPYWADSGSPEEIKEDLAICKGTTEVVIDYPALITMAQIDAPFLIPFFKQVYVPAHILEQIQIDLLRINERLGYLREQGQRKLLQDLKEMGIIDASRVAMPESGNWPEASLQDKYLCDKTGASYLINLNILRHQEAEKLSEKAITTHELIEFFWAKGLIKQNEYDQALQYLAKTANLSEKISRVKELPESMVIEFTTLSTLQSLGILRLLDGQTTLLISPWTGYLLGGEVSEENAHEEALKIVEKIETTILKSKNVTIVDISTSLEDKDRVWRPAIALAEEKGLPLWSDDLITAAFYKNETKVAASFSTRTVLTNAFQKNLVSPDIYHQSIVSLVVMGFSYCSFDAENLTWAIRQNNYHESNDVKSLLAARGEPRPFWRLAAKAISNLAESREKTGNPADHQLSSWMRKLSSLTCEHSARIPLLYVENVTRMLDERSLQIRLLWQLNVDIWKAIGWCSDRI